MIRHKGFEESDGVKEYTLENARAEKNGYAVLAKNNEGGYTLICECRFVGDEDETEEE